MGTRKKKKDEGTASGEDTTSSRPAVPSRQGTTCLATSGSLDPPAQAPDILSSSEMETGKTRGGTRFSVGGGNDASTTSATATTPPAAGTIQPGDVQGRPLRWTPLGLFQHRLIQVWTRGTYRQWVRDVFLLAARALNWHVRWHAPPRQLNAGWPIKMRT